MKILSSQCLIGICLILVGCSSLSPKVAKHSFDAPPKLSEGSLLRLGGHSGLLFLHEEKNGDLVFMTHTDRGPNHELMGKKRPFVLPNYSPELIKFSVTTSGDVQVLERIALKDPKGNGISGLPNLKGDESPVDSQGNLLEVDVAGVDLEGIVLDGKGNWWMVEEYRPSVLMLNSKGILTKRFVPKGSFSKSEVKAFEKRFGKGSLIQNLPQELSARRMNRGFEGVSIVANTLYAILQSPYKKGDTKIPILEFDLVRMRPLRISYYELASSKAEKIGDITHKDGKFYVIEQNGKLGSKAILDVVEISKSSEFTWQAKQRWSLPKLGINDIEKMEGLVVLPDGRFVLVNDNDFALGGDVKNHVFFIDRE